MKVTEDTGHGHLLALVRLASWTVHIDKAPEQGTVGGITVGKVYRWINTKITPFYSFIAVTSSSLQFLLGTGHYKNHPLSSSWVGTSLKSFSPLIALSGHFRFVLQDVKLKWESGNSYSTSRCGPRSRWRSSRYGPGNYSVYTELNPNHTLGI
jgi:hypothetical protein